MKKIIAFCFLFIMIQTLAFADEIIDAKGNITPCQITSVSDGFIEYKKDGNLYSFTRGQSSPVFNDYVDTRINMLKKDSIVRISGNIIIKDLWSVTIKNENGSIDIPFYKVKQVGMYKP